MTSRTDHDLAPGLVDQVASLASGATSSVAATEATLSRIEATQPHLNAFKIVRGEKALEEAAEADRRFARGERLPLLGVPIAVKDDVDITGEPTAFGCPGDFPAKTEDSEMIRRLRDAGAVIVGKTNSPELGQWPLTSGSAFGYTRNPWSRHHTPGGSSGGTRRGRRRRIGHGRNRFPTVPVPSESLRPGPTSSEIKPQRGRISTWPDAEAFYGLTVNGPLARTVADAALLLDVAAGNHDGDLHKPTPVTVSDAVGRDPGKLKIALSLRNPFTATPVKLDPEVRLAVHSIADTLRELGHHVVVDDPAYGLIFGLNFLPRTLRRGPRLARTRSRPDTRRCPNTWKCTERQATFAAHLCARPARPSRGCESGSERSSTPTTSSWHPRRQLHRSWRPAIDGIGGWDTDKVMTGALPLRVAVECPRLALGQRAGRIQQGRPAPSVRS